MNTRITVAQGDGIGPEIMKATLRILEAAEARLTYDFIEVGEQVYLSGQTSGIRIADWDIIRRNKVFLKGPITTPQGSGYKSINVSTRKYLGLYANIRPCVAYAPFVKTLHPTMNVTIIRENEEDLYAGIEHQQTDDVVQCLKLISRSGCERIIRYAFEYARVHNRKKITCMTKDNIMKQTDGLFHTVFDEVKVSYPEIETEHLIIDIGAARLADTPERFDVIVTSNLYGDIISDIAAQVAGSVGLAGSSNIGSSCAMFEAVHGSAPDLAGSNQANPSGLIQAAVLMLHHVQQPDIADKIQNAWLRTLEEGYHTADIYMEGISAVRCSTDAFADAVIARLGKTPQILNTVQSETTIKPMQLKVNKPSHATKELEGVDFFVHWQHDDPNTLATIMQELEQEHCKLTMITNRGIKVWPEGFPETYCTDHWRCRFKWHKDERMPASVIVAMLEKAIQHKLDIIKTENLYRFNGKPAYSLGQGQ